MIMIDVLRVERRQAAGYGTCSNSARAVAGERDSPVVSRPLCNLIFGLIEGGTSRLE